MKKQEQRLRLAKHLLLNNIASLNKRGLSILDNPFKSFWADQGDRLGDRSDQWDCPGDRAEGQVE